MPELVVAETADAPASRVRLRLRTGAPVATSNPLRNPAPSTTYTTPLATVGGLYDVAPCVEPVQLGEPLAPSRRKSSPGGPALVNTAPSADAGEAELQARHGR